MGYGWVINFCWSCETEGLVWGPQSFASWNLLGFAGGLDWGWGLLIWSRGLGLLFGCFRQDGCGIGFLVGGLGARF